MTKRHYGDWLRAFTEFASYGEAPPYMYFWVGVSTIAGALRRRVWIDQKYFKWIPNFYVILVAPPGIVSKTTTASIGMSLLREVPGIHFGPDVVTWQALAQALAQSTEMTEMEDGLLHSMSAITMESGEFGTFLNPSDREMVDLLVTLWDSKEGVFRKLTKTQGEDVIANPFVNFIACTTPAWIEGNFPEYMIGGGFTSRCVFVYADAKHNYVAYPHLVVPKDFEDTKKRLIADLEIISQMRGPFDFTPDAIEWGTAWYKHHYENRPAHLDNDRYGGYIARKQTHIHKLAMILSASESDSRKLTLKNLEASAAIVTSLEDHMTKVFDRIGRTDDTRKAGDLITIVRNYGTIEHQALYSMLFRTMSYDDFTVALKSSLQAGLIKQEQHGDKLIIKLVVKNG